MQLHLNTTLSLSDVAEQIASHILRGCEVEERDGLNLGGGDYFLFKSGSTEVILVSNDADHADVFVPERKDFPYYCYVWAGSEDLLERMLSSLPAANLVGE